MHQSGDISPRTAGAYHVPVLLEEAVGGLAISERMTIIDATLGGGGYSDYILGAFPKCQVIGLDTDPNALKAATARLEKYGNRFRAVQANFGTIGEVIPTIAEQVDGIVYDLGVSSNQLDTVSIGLSYRIDAPLDMRLDPRIARSAKDIVMTSDEDELRRIFKEYGEERMSGQIARKVVKARQIELIASTVQLAQVVGQGIREDKRNAVLSRIFQALRIEVNDELGVLARSLRSALDLIRPGGRISVVSYHSLEDRIVKNFFAAESAPKSKPGSKDFLRSSVDLSRARLRLISRKPILPSDAEIARNSRARSAKLRIAEVLKAPDA